MATATKLNQSLKAFIEAQHMFFVGTAAADGRVNISPKGMDSLRVVSDTQIVWLNLTGSGNESAAHVRELSRMTLMFCAFEGDARILRVYGQAICLHPRDDEWDNYVKGFPTMAGSRQIFVLNIELVQTSCGTGVPLMKMVEQRGNKELLPFYDEMGEDGVRDYWKRRNSLSLDGKETGV
jgi:hypothetical protein